VTRFIVGVDIGGTFTDASAVSLGDGRVFAAKARSTPSDLVEGLVDSLELLAGEVGIPLARLLADTVKFAHGTTQTSNVIYTWRGAKVGLLTTRGFADELLIMRARGRVAGISLSGRRHLRATSKPPQIVPRSRIEELSERVDHRGRVLVPLDESEVVEATERLLAAGIDSLAVSLLWSPENPEHELLAERVVRSRWPDLHVSLSHRLAPVLGEYERASTTVVNAWVAPTVERYLSRVEERLAEHGMETPVLVLQANGGVVQVEDTVPVRTIESGPAAGMVAVRALAEAIGVDRVIATDVGGTTFKVGLLIDGAWTTARETIINQYTLLMPMIDLVSIGAGGGSIAWVDGERLRVGPDSAGADPGPVCYGWGGTRPTVTDADLVLGFIDPNTFLGGRLRLDTERAVAANRSAIADRLFDGDVVHAAAAIRRVVDAQMGDLIRKATIEHGHDPRGFVLAAYGGAGPLHAADYARGLGIGMIVVPEAATAFSAYGAAASDIAVTRERSVRPELFDDPAGLEAAFATLEADASAIVRRQSVASTSTRTARWVDMKYEAQLHDVRVVLADGLVDRDSLRRQFEARYAVIFGSNARLTRAGVQLLRIGVEAVGAITKPPILERSGGHREAVPVTRRDVFWPSEVAWLDTGAYDGTALRPGDFLGGPAVIDLPGTCIVVPPGARAEIEAHGHTIIRSAGVAPPTSLLKAEAVR
jgi:N-methylhydantoinase A